MRFAVMADIHGNLLALEAVLDDIENEAVDGIIIAGDLSGGPEMVETIRRIRSLEAWVIRGNNEEYFFRYQNGTAPDAWRTTSQWAPMRWLYQQLDDEIFDYLRALPEQQVIPLDGKIAIRVVHGSPRSSSEQIHPDSDPSILHQALDQIDESVMVCGHTHLPWKRIYKEQLAVNPGAVCGPLNGFIGAQYALLTWHRQRWEVEHRAIPYDMQRLRASFYESGFLTEGGTFARALLYTIESGRNVAREFLIYARRLATEAGFQGFDAVPDVIWEQATLSFDWTPYEVRLN